MDVGNNARIGPFYFKFDALEILKLHGMTDEAPKIECRRHKCRSENMFPWFNVESIVYRGSLSDSPIVLPVAYDAQEMLTTIWSNKDVRSSVAISFDIPKNWKSLYYVIKFKDGTETTEVRLIL